MHESMHRRARGGDRDEQRNRSDTPGRRHGDGNAYIRQIVELIRSDS